MKVTVDSVQLRLEQDNGKRNDRQLYTIKTISNVKTEALPEQLLQVSEAISSLSSKAVLNTKRVETQLITREED